MDKQEQRSSGKKESRTGKKEEIRRISLEKKKTEAKAHEQHQPHLFPSLL